MAYEIVFYLPYGWLDGPFGVVGRSKARHWETHHHKAGKAGKATLDFSCGCLWRGGENETWTLKVIAKLSLPQR